MAGHERINQAPDKARAHAQRDGDAAFKPLYRQIKLLIVQDMQAGVWKPGEMIPGEFELAARFGVSQGTVRKAIDDLAAENLLTRRQGKGTFVATHAEQTTRYRFCAWLPTTAAAATCSDACCTVAACAPAPTSRGRWS